ncbi:YceI family protein [Paenibacillus pinistramenti]|uniref:YceI family protein n=1 Tax=Paenibacillus pinistramenti TaxID=1768003 RepID=UPI001108D0B7|nr:YceI family protein [Paenibacillus pinistramenti]
MNKRSWIIVSGALVIVLVVFGYTFLKSYMGNNIEISSVMPAQAAEADPNGGTSEAGADSGAAVSAEALNGEWTISEGSKVYYSVTTSQETVNFVNEKVNGSWTVDLDNPEAMKGSGKIDMTANDSGNSMRDEHIRGAEFFDAAAYPEAEFTAKSFDNLTSGWKEGAALPFTLTGTLKVRGIEKEVSIDAKVMYSGGKLLLSGTTVVTFSDFGMKNPHTVVLDTENDIKVQLELILTKN